MPNITLYHASPSRSSIVLWMLEEVGQPYDIKLIRLSASDNLKPDYLAINPMGKVPSLRHGDTVITEGARDKFGKKTTIEQSRRVVLPLEV